MHIFISQVANLVSLGFDEQKARHALQLTKGDIEAAVEFITAAETPVTPLSAEEEAKVNAEMELLKDVKDDPDAYLDITIDDELEAFNQYQAMLFSM